MKTTTVYTGDLTEAQKEDIKKSVQKSRNEYFVNVWEDAEDPFECVSNFQDMPKVTFDLSFYKNHPVYQFYERLLEAINN